jgi:hypothetical protein
MNRRGFFSRIGALAASAFVPRGVAALAAEVPFSEPAWYGFVGVDTYEENVDALITGEFGRYEGFSFIYPKE